MKKLFTPVLCLLLLVGCLCLGSCGGDGNKNKIRLTLCNLNLNYPEYTYDWVLDKGTTAGFIIPPSESFYTFLGYFDAPTGGTQVIDAEGHTRYIPSESMSLYAQWAPNVYELVLDPAEGTLPGGSTQSETYTYAYKSAISSFPVPVREGYDFLGWYCGETVVSGKGGTPTLDSAQLDFPPYQTESDGRIHLTARWQMRRVKVTFDYNDGTGRTETRELDYGATLSQAELPSYVDGNRVTVGFSYSPTSTSLVAGDLTSLTRDLTLYAVWDSFVTVTLHKTPSETVTVRVAERTPYPLTAPERHGYAFEGWYDDNSGAPAEGSLTYGSAASSYTARWSLITYTVTYDGGGALYGKTEESLLRSVEQPAPLPKHGYYNGEYIFDGWNTAPDGSGIAFADGATVDFIPGAEDGSVTLYAQWRLKKYTVTLDYANPSKRPVVAPENCTVTEVTVYMDRTYVLPTPTCKYFNFIGWEIGGIVCNSEDLWTLDVGEDGATVSARAVWERAVDVTVPLTLERVPEEPIRITDENVMQQQMYVVTTGYERSMLEAYGYVGFVVTITVEITEIDDGYQHVLIYNANTTDECVHDLIIEHGPGYTNTETGTHTVTAVVPVQKLNYYGGLKVYFSAHGNSSDTWLLGKTTYTFTFNQ